MSQQSAEEQRFIDYLEWLLERSEDSRAAMAKLRRGMGKPPGAVPEMDRYVLTHLPESANFRQEEPYYLVAALFAYWYQSKNKAETVKEGNLGKSLRNLVKKQISEGADRENSEKGIEKRLNALLNSHRDDLPEHLRRIIGLLRAKDVPIYWAQLLYDIQHWDAENRFVQHAWAKGFWTTNRESTPAKTEKE